MNPDQGGYPSRLGIMLTGLAVTSAGLVLMLEAHLGVTPWEVLTAGIAGQTGLDLGWTRLAVLVALAVVLLLLRVRLRTGTVLVVSLYPAMVVLAQTIIPDLGGGPTRGLALVAGVALMGVGGGLYLVPAVGAAPTDLLVGDLARRSAKPLWLVRVAMESAALGGGWLLGTSPGPGTLAFALAVGPVVSLTILLLSGREVRRPTGQLGGGGFVPAPVDLRSLRRALARIPHRVHRARNPH